MRQMTGHTERQREDCPKQQQDFRRVLRDVARDFGSGVAESAISPCKHEREQVGRDAPEVPYTSSPCSPHAVPG